MKELRFCKSSTIDGVISIASIVPFVKGYTKTVILGMTIFRRLDIGYIVSSYRNIYRFRKYDYFTEKYQAFTYDELRRFIEFKHIIQFKGDHERWQRPNE